MTEKYPDDIDLMAQQLTDTEAEKAAYLELCWAYAREHCAFLEAHGERTAWHPDDEERAARREELTQRFIGASPEERTQRDLYEIDSLITDRQMGEVRMHGYLSELRSAQAQGTGSLIDREEAKKELQAMLMVWGFRDAWLSVVDLFLDGDSIDLNKEHDAAIFARVADQRDRVAVDPLRNRLLNIFAGPYDDAVSMDVELARQIKNTYDLTLIRLQNVRLDPTHVPSVAAYFDELKRDGHITPGQAGALHALLANMPPPLQNP